MKPIAPKPQRCAIYTRKSTEHNLDLVDGTAPSDLTVTGLAKALPYSQTQ